MNYFQILGISFGLIAFLKPFYMHVLPWDENRFIANTYSQKRPKWVVPIAIIGLMLVGFTWYKELTTDIEFSFIITILFSLTVVKAILLLFDYKKFYNWVANMLKKEKSQKIILIDALVGLFGLTLILLSILFL